MGVKTFAIFVSIFIFLFVIELIRRQKMTFKYSISWLGVSSVVLFFAFNENLLRKISDFFGFQLPSNFIFFLLSAFFIFLSLLLTVYINEQNNRTESLAQTIGMLEFKIKKMQSPEQKK